MLALPKPSESTSQLEAYYRNRITELVGEQLLVFAFAFDLMDSPSEQYRLDAIYKYWTAEEQIQKCRNSLISFRKA